MQQSTLLSLIEKRESWGGEDMSSAEVLQLQRELEAAHSTIRSLTRERNELKIQVTDLTTQLFRLRNAAAPAEPVHPRVVNPQRIAIIDAVTEEVRYQT